MALLTDQYQLTMVQAYWREQMLDDAVFSLFVRRLPETRSFLVAAGLDDVLGLLERFHFSDDSLGWLRTRETFAPDFIDWLAGLRFTGEVRAVREGTVLFANEPILEVRAPLPEAQLVETLLMNQVHLQTMVASKVARVVLAAGGRPVVEFGLRRLHGADAGLRAARAAWIAGAAGTSNVLAGRTWGIPTLGTMAHSYVQAHDSELEAFRAFVGHHRDTVLLVDTYDTLEGVRNVVRLAGELGSDFHVGAIRLDSGDLVALARESRRMLDEAGLERVEIFASGSLDEYEIRRLLQAGAPIDAFGVGTRMGVSADAPSLDIAYKLAEYGGRGRLKLSPGKPILPGAKQVFREVRDGRIVRDTIARAGEAHAGQPLLEPVMQHGRRLPAGAVALEHIREHAAAELRSLPDGLRSLDAAGPPFAPDVSDELAGLAQALTRNLARS